MNRPSTWRAVLVAVALFIAAPATARDISDVLQSRLQEANARLAVLGTHEMADEAALELGQARLEVSEIQGKLTVADYGWATIIMNRLEARLDLIGSICERAVMEQLANQRESELFDMTSEADRIQLDLETTQLRRTQLQDEVSAIVDAMNSEQ